MITIGLVDNQTLMREGLRCLLEREPDFKILCEAATGQEGWQVVQEHRPNVLLMELLLPELHGLDLLRKLKGQEEVRPVIITAHSNASYVIEALKNGAQGYLLKDNTFSEVQEAIRSAVKGEHYLSKELRNCALELTLGRHARNGHNGDDRLTTRERVVLELAAEGYTNSEIASRLTISRRTVESHRASLMEKLALRSQTDLVRYAVRHQIIRP